MTDRFYVDFVSVGSAGLTARPTVLDRQSGRAVKTFRRTEEHLAVKLATKLNAQKGNTMISDEERAAWYGAADRVVETQVGRLVEAFGGEVSAPALLALKRVARNESSADIDALVAEISKLRGGS